MTETTDMAEDATVDAVALDDGTGAPGLVPAVVLGTDPLWLAVSYRDGTIHEHGTVDAPLPASDVAAPSNEPFSDDTPLWGLSLTTEASAGTWVAHLRWHCPRLVSLILGLWPVDRARRHPRRRRPSCVPAADRSGPPRPRRGAHRDRPAPAARRSVRLVAAPHARRPPGIRPRGLRRAHRPASRSHPAGPSLRPDRAILTHGKCGIHGCCAATTLPHWIVNEPKMGCG